MHKENINSSNHGVDENNENSLPPGMDDNDWDLLLRRIKKGNCTPFLGAGACSPYLPLSGQIAQILAEEYEYPLLDIDDLPKVAQFLAIERKDSIFPKEIVIDILKGYKPPDSAGPEVVHSILADLPLPVYLTTNYDDFMIQALHKKRKTVASDYCRWNDYTYKEPPNISEDFKPTADNPLVYHLHGFWDVPESLVLTEDDYIDFLVNVSGNIDHSLHHRIRRSLTGTSLIFIGYRFKELNFRTIFRGLINSPEKSLKRKSISVQITPKKEQKEKMNRSIKSLEEFVSGLINNKSNNKKINNINNKGENDNNEIIALLSSLQEQARKSNISREEKDSMYQTINALEHKLIDMTAGNSKNKKFIVNIINKLQESVGILPTKGDLGDQQAVNYLEKYYKEMDISVYWGEAEQFAKELAQRWEDFK